MCHCDGAICLINNFIAFLTAVVLQSAKSRLITFYGYIQTPFEMSKNFIWTEQPYTNIWAHINICLQAIATVKCDHSSSLTDQQN